MRSPRIVRGVGLALLMFLLSGVALGYYTANGAGSGNAAGASATGISAVSATPVAGLYPGGGSELALTFSNPNATAIHVPSLQLDTSRGVNGFAVDSGHNAGCTTPALSFTQQDNGGTGWDVPAKVGATNGTFTIHLANGVSMGVGASNGCQGATFTVYLKSGS
jgi:hypothetical protein